RVARGRWAPARSPEPTHRRCGHRLTAYARSGSFHDAAGTLRSARRAGNTRTMPAGDRRDPVRLLARPRPRVHVLREVGHARRLVADVLRVVDQAADAMCRRA